MNIDLIPTGDNPPDNLNVIIEVPVGGEPVKYEFDKNGRSAVRGPGSVAMGYGGKTARHRLRYQCSP